LPYWALGFADTTLRVLGSDDFAPEVKAHAASELTSALLDATLRIPIAERLPLDDIAIAHEHVEVGTPGRVIVHV
jgi:NADPH2:quinone reductase